MENDTPKTAGRKSNLLVKDFDALRENVANHLENDTPLAPNVEETPSGEFIARYVSVDSQSGNVTAKQFAAKTSPIRGIVEVLTLAAEKKLPIESAFVRLTAGN